MYVDTNIILRVLLNDHPDHTAKALRFLNKVKQRGWYLQTSEAVITEVFYVLESHRKTFRLDRNRIADLVFDFVILSGIEFPARNCIRRIVDVYKRHTIDITDAILAVRAEQSGEKVVSFDQDLDKVNRAIRLEPA